MAQRIVEDLQTLDTCCENEDDREPERIEALRERLLRYRRILRKIENDARRARRLAG